MIFHLCGESFYFLIVLTWRNQNEMWESLYGQDVAKGGGFQLIPQGTHLEVICVWELGAVVHERQAWTEYLMSAPGRAGQDGLPHQPVLRTRLRNKQTTGCPSRAGTR